jgi:hypothetical protein
MKTKMKDDLENSRYIFSRQCLGGIGYPRIKMQSVHCVGTTSIPTFAPSVSVSYVS